MFPSSPKRLRTDQRFCPHCNNLLSYKTYRAHKRLYYNETEETWYHVSQQEGTCDIEEGPPSEHVFHSESTGSPPPLSPCSVPEDMSECDDSQEDSPPHSEAALSDSDGKSVIIEPASPHTVVLVTFSF